MSGRRLGGGRILGSGKGLGPTPPAVPRSSSPFAPSESTVSIASSSISPPASGSLADLTQDIGSSISVGAQPKGGAAGASSLVCPICSEEMVTLLQLNRHIDDTHQELPTEEQNEVKTWFDKQVLKAKRFQPLSIINMKLRGLEVFESNESNPITPPLPTGTSSSSKLPIETPIDPEEFITRSHWQRSTGEGYNDHNGTTVDHTDMFKSVRRNKVERHTLEVSRLEKRLTKLTRLLANSPEALANPSNGSLLGPVQSLTGQKNPRKLIEQSVVTWEEDDKVPECPFCRQEFGSWTFRRHHCRICGRVVCGDPQTGCSSEVSLSIAGPTGPGAEKPPSSAGNGHMAVDIRMCKECNSTIFSSRDFAASLAYRPPDQRAYETLRQFERGIRQLLPSFHRALQALQPEVKENGEVDFNKPPPTHAQIQEASKIRKRLIDSFSKYGSAAKRLRDLNTDSPTQQRLQVAVYAYASSFLHTNMLPLKNLPQMLRHRSTPSTSSSHSHFLPSTNHSTSSLRHSELAESENASQAPSETSTVVSLLETEEKDLKERLAVLEEQKFMVEEMVRSAHGARRFEEVSALSRNLDELTGEIQGLRKKIGDVEKKWEVAYRNGA
ncbi:hypothetical protein Trihar35433_6537 [Trichoderma harzianum]|nr:hypothetical protein Trihar35433_6537 [Trichoderma harzianum]